MRHILAAAFVLGHSAAAFAAEPEGCDKFKWPIEKDRAALTATDRVAVQTGATPTLSGKAFAVALKPTETADLPMAPERAPKADRYAGYLQMAAPEKASSYTLSMSSGIWIDVIQDGKFLKPAAFSGATGCDGIRKTMRFDLAAQRFVVQISGSAEPEISLLVRPSD